MAGNYFASLGKSVVSSAVDTAVDAGRTYVGGLINEHFARRSEQRADERNRKLLYDQPLLTVEGRRAAGLNPYGDATLPPMSAQSTVDTSLAAGASSFDDYMAIERLKIDRALADAEIKNKDASTQYTLESIVGVTLSNEIKAIEKEVAAFNFEVDKQKAPLLVKELEASIDKLDAEKQKLLASAEVDEKQLAVMEASIDKLNAEVLLINAQIALAESGIEVNKATIENMRARLAFDKEVEERVATQGLAGLRIDAAQVGLDKDKFDWEKIARTVEQELKDEGLDVEWSSLGIGALQTVAWLAIFYFSRNPNTATAGSKGFSTIVRRVLKTYKPPKPKYVNPTNGVSHIGNRKK